MMHTKIIATADATANTATAIHINGAIGSVCMYCIILSYRITLFANINILFFKLWGMTNNVRNIWWKMDESGMIRFYLITSQKEKAYQCIISSLYNELSNNVLFISKDGFREKTGGIIEKYNKMVKEIGYELPDMLSTPDKFYENYKRIGNL